MTLKSGLAVAYCRYCVFQQKNIHKSKGRTDVQKSAWVHLLLINRSYYEKCVIFRSCNSMLVIQTICVLKGRSDLDSLICYSTVQNPYFLSCDLTLSHFQNLLWQKKSSLLFSQGTEPRRVVGFSQSKVHKW